MKDSRMWSVHGWMATDFAENFPLLFSFLIISSSSFFFFFFFLFLILDNSFCKCLILSSIRFHHVHVLSTREEKGWYFTY